jgi:hypothetical protein
VGSAEVAEIRAQIQTTQSLFSESVKSVASINAVRVMLRVIGEVEIIVALRSDRAAQEVRVIRRQEGRRVALLEIVVVGVDSVTET